MKSPFFLRRILPILLLLPLLAGCKDTAETSETALRHAQTDLPIDDSLRQRVSAYIQRKNWDERLALYIYDITAEKAVYEYRKDALMPPASCMKLLTGITAIKLLGPHFPFHTRLYTHGNIGNGTLHGDIVISGGLDPMLTTTELSALLQNLRTRDIRSVTGKIILDLDVEDTPSDEEHWIPGDLKRNKYGLFFQGRKRIEQEIKSILHTRGVDFAEKNITWAEIPKGSHCIGAVRTPIRDLLMTMWKNSANERTESLLYALGKYSGHRDSLRHYGMACLQRFIHEELGRDSTSYRLHDGCGMCVYNALSPALLVDLLRYACQNRDTYHLLLRTLPKSGVDGTLIYRMQNPHTHKRILAKTGTLTRENGVSTLSGYFKDRQGHLLCFSIMNKHVPVADAQLFQDKLCAEFLEKKENQRQ